MEQNDFMAAMQQETTKVEVAKEQESTEVSAEKVLSVLSVIILVCGILEYLQKNRIFFIFIHLFLFLSYW